MPEYAPPAYATEELQAEHSNTVTTLQRYPGVINPGQAYVLSQLDE